MRTYIGIDNGVTGSIAVVYETAVEFLMMPVFREQNYTKKKRQISRVHWQELENILKRWRTKDTRVFLERPYTGTRTHTVISAMRCLEATLIVIERMKLSYEYVDSRSWQKLLLPKGIKGSEELKKASVDIGIRLFPDFENAIRSHKDADSLLIAEWARREGL